MIKKDPICGNCGQPLSKHYHEDDEYCYDNTNGDVFTDEPSDCILLSFIERKHTWLHKQFIHNWKVMNGHLKD